MSTSKAKPGDAAPYVTKSEIEEYLAYEEERKSLERQAAALENKAAPLKTRFVKFVECQGGKARTVLRSGFVLSIKERAGRVAWKDKYVELTSVEASEVLIANCPPSTYLDVQRAA